MNQKSNIKYIEINISLDNKISFCFIKSHLYCNLHYDKNDSSIGEKDKWKFKPVIILQLRGYSKN